jgi:ubiquinone/menaquinone biosynthesis C-methylase UbiE
MYISPHTSSDPKYRHYPEARFGGYPDIDQVAVFYTRVRSLLSPSSVVLDIGCGRGRHQEDPIAVRRELRSLKGACKRTIGIDVDPEAKLNPSIDEFHLIDSHGSWLVEDESVDLAVSDYVLEHVERPDVFFAECARVIKPGGFLCIRTTNKRSYFGLAARLTPNAVHASVIRSVYRNPRAADDVFPTRYRCNTLKAVRTMLDRHGFEHCVYGYQSDPGHFGFSPLLYALGVVHQRYAPSAIKPAIFTFARRRSREAAGARVRSASIS